MLKKKMNTVRFFDLNMGSLPNELPVLILPEVFLLPEGKFSVRITDVKQITKIFWTLANGRMFAVFPKASDCQIGCAARISGFSENEDDSLSLSLVGVSRFKVAERFTKDTYDMVKVDFLPYSDDFDAVQINDEATLLLHLNHYLKNRSIDIDVDLFTKMSPRRLLATLVSVLPFDYLEKQVIFECVSFDEAIETMITILKISLMNENLEKEKQKC